MKLFFLLATITLLGNCLFAQSGMIMTVKDRKCDILGYTMDPEGSGNKQSISLLGSMQNAEAIFQMSYETGNTIGNIVISISDPSSPEPNTITLTDVTVYGIKAYLSNYTNGIFNISSNGNVNTEIKCKFKEIGIHAVGSGTGSLNEKGNIQSENLKSQTAQKWEIKSDSTLTGITGQLVLELPKEIAVASHLQAFLTGETKPAISWFGNKKDKLMPGTYDIVLEKYRLNNVRIEKGKTTRLKVGVLNFSARQGVTIVDSNQQKFSMAGPFRIALPVGIYTINGNKEMAFTIKDGEQTKY